jgi:hypothetical protein
MSETAGQHPDVKPPTVLRFAIAAPHGTRIHAAVHGIEIHYPDTMKNEMVKWLESLPSFFTATQATELLVPCPCCGGKGITMVNDKATLCVLCAGKTRVSRETAASFKSVTENDNQ